MQWQQALNKETTEIQMSSNQNPGSLLYIGDYTNTTQLKGDYNKPL